MRSLLVLVAGLAAAFAAPAEAPAAHGPQTPEALSLAPAPTCTAELETLRHEAAALKRQLLMLRSQRGAADAWPRQMKKLGPGSGEGQLELAPDSGEAAQRRLRAAAISERFEAEKVDTEWALVAEYRVRAALDRVVLGRAGEHGISCRGSLCRLEVHANDPAQVSTLGRDLVMRLSSEFERGHMHRDETDPARPSLIFYLVRDGHRLLAASN